jgi:hypothetical protein
VPVEVEAVRELRNGLVPSDDNSARVERNERRDIIKDVGTEVDVI